MVIWFTGMSGAGKSTLTVALGSQLEKKGFSVNYLDGDAVRNINKTTDNFTCETIIKNNHSIIQECARTVEQYDFILVSVVSPFEETRQYARCVLAEEYFEIYVKCPISELVQRDTKGLYQKAKCGKKDNLIGFSDKLPYEEPSNADLVIRTDRSDKKESIAMILTQLQLKGEFFV